MVYRSATAHGEKRNLRQFLVWNNHVQRGHVTTAIPDAAFSAVRFCSNTVRCTQYDRPSWRQLYASCSLVCELYPFGLLFHRPFYTNVVSVGDLVHSQGFNALMFQCFCSKVK